MEFEQPRPACRPKVLTQLVATALISLCAGCSSSNPGNVRSGYGRVITPLPPAFLTSAAALLLTNNEGFSARAEIQSEALFGQKGSEGALLGRGGLLLYAPNDGELTDTHRQPGGYSFVWNVREHRGFVFSEALQGYAPVTAALQVTNFQIVPVVSGSERVGGHPCESARAVALSSAGNSSAFDFLRAVDLHGFPMRIVAVTNNPSFTVMLTKVRMEPPAAAIFSPPDGFTKYPSPEAMADELAARQHNLRRKNVPQLDQLLDQPRRY